MMAESRRESIGDGDDVESTAQNNNDQALIATYMQTQTEVATHLCIHGQALKLLSETNNEFSIGGTYNGEKEEFWFFGSTSLCHGNNYLLNLFVTSHKDVRFSLFLPSNGYNLTDHIKVNVAKKCWEITGHTKEYAFTSSKRDEVVFVKAYRFTKADIEELKDSTLLVPCSIQIHSSYRIHPDVVNQIKLQYTVQLNEALYKSRAEGDFILESVTSKEYPVHLFVAAAHSIVLRNVIMHNRKSYFIPFKDVYVKMLIAFLYNGSVENITATKALKILEMNDMLGLPGLLKLGIVALSENINAENAIEIAIQAKKYELKELSIKVFQFIKENPVVLLSNGIEDLNDIELMRTMLQQVGNLPCQCKAKKNAGV